MTNKRSVASRFTLIGRYPFLSGSPAVTRSVFVYRHYWR
jgi:hypothetical protein